MSDFLSSLGNNIIPNGGILNRKIDFQRENFLKGISNSKHGKKEDPTYLYFKFVFDWGNTSQLDPETFLAPSPLFRGTEADYEKELKWKDESVAANNITTMDALDKTINDITKATANGFYTDMDFFYGAKGRIADRAEHGFFSMNGGSVGYMGAQNFLKQRSIKRMQMLQAFKNGINYINKECPYYFQSLSGLDALLKTDIKNYHKPNGSLKRTGTLTIDCLESIDMRLFSIAELYRKAIYDFTYHRVMLPENLRKFRMWLVITELRNVQLTQNMNDVLNPFSIPAVSQAANYLDSFNSQTGLLNSTQGLLGKSTDRSGNSVDNNDFALYAMAPYAFIYQFDQCEFDFDSTYPSYGLIDNKGGAAVSEQFKIHVGRVKDYKIQFNQLSDVIQKEDNIQQMVLSDIWGTKTSDYQNYDYFDSEGITSSTFSDKENASEYFANIASKFITNTVSDLKNQGVSVIENELLGNAYGFGGVNLGSSLSNVQSVVNTIEGGVPNPFAKNDPQSRGFGGPPQRQYPTLSEDVYPTVPSMPGENLGNVLPGGGAPGVLNPEDLYPNVPGSDLGLPNRVYPVVNDDQYSDVPGGSLGVPDRVYPVPGGDVYPTNPGADSGLPDRVYPSNNTDEYSNVPGSDLGPPDRVYPIPGGDVYSTNPGSSLGLPDRVYPTVNLDEYSNVPGTDLGTPDRPYPNLNEDVYGNNPGSDLGLPSRQYPEINENVYPNNPVMDNTQNLASVYTDKKKPEYPEIHEDEYPSVPGEDLGPRGRKYGSVNEGIYNRKNFNYPGINEDEYNDPSIVDTKKIGRVY